jgi:hypothetical protein
MGTRAIAGYLMAPARPHVAGEGARVADVAGTQDSHGVTAPAQRSRQGSDVLTHTAGVEAVVRGHHDDVHAGLPAAVTPGAQTRRGDVRGSDSRFSPWKISETD